MEVSHLLTRLTAASTMDRRAALDQLLQSLLPVAPSAPQTARLVDLDDPSALYSALSSALVDPDWQVRLTSIQLINELVARNPWPSRLDAAMSQVLPRLIPCLGDVKVTVRRAVTQCLHLYLRQSPDFGTAVSSLVRYGLGTGDATLTRDCCIALPVLLTPDICLQDDIFKIVHALASLSTRGDEHVVKSSLKALNMMEQMIGVETFGQHLGRLSTSLRRDYQLAKAAAGVLTPLPSRPPTVGSVTENSDLYCGFIPPETRELMEKSEDPRDRFQAVEEIKIRYDQLMRRSSHKVLTHAPQFFSLLETLLQDVNFHVVKLALEMLCLLIETLSAFLTPHVRRLVYLLYRAMGDPRLLVQVWVMKYSMTLVRYLDSQLVLSLLLDSLKDNRNWRVRQEMVNVVIAALLQFPRDDFELDKLCSLVAPVLIDRKHWVRVAGLECCAVLAHLLGPGSLQPLVEVVDAVELQSDVEGVMEAVQARLSHRKLPHLTAQGLVQYVTRPAIVPRSTSRDSSSLEILDLEGQTNNSERRRPSAQKGTRNRNKLPWDVPSEQSSDAPAHRPSSPDHVTPTRGQSPPPIRTTVAWTDSADSNNGTSPFSRANHTALKPPDDAAINDSFSYVPARPHEIRKVKDIVKEESPSTPVKHSKPLIASSSLRNSYSNPIKPSTNSPREVNVTPTNNNNSNQKPTATIKPSYAPSTNGKMSYSQPANQNQPSVNSNQSEQKDILTRASKIPTQAVVNYTKALLPDKAVTPIQTINSSKNGPIKSAGDLDNTSQEKKSGLAGPKVGKGSYQQVFIERRRRTIDMENAPNLSGLGTPNSRREYESSLIPIRASDSYSDSRRGSNQESERNTGRIANQDSERNTGRIANQDSERNTGRITNQDLDSSRRSRTDQLLDDDVDIPPTEILTALSTIRRSATKKKAIKAEAESRTSTADYSYSGIDTPFSLYSDDKTGFTTPQKIDSGIIVNSEVNADSTSQSASQTLKDLANERKVRQAEMESKRRQDAEEAKRKELERKLAQLQQERKLEEEEAARRKAEMLDNDSGLVSPFLDDVRESRLNSQNKADIKPNQNKSQLSRTAPSSSGIFSPPTPAPTGPLSHPEKTITELLSLISHSDWQDKIDGLSLLQRLIEYHAPVLTSRPVDLHQISLALVQECKNLRSQVSRVAVRSLSLMYQHLKKSCDPDLELTTGVLLCKAGESSGFIRDDVENALLSMVHNSTPQKALTALLVTGPNHKNSAIRRTCAYYLSQLCERMGPAKILSGAKDVTDKTLPVAAQFTIDGNTETRYYGRKIFHGLLSHPDFDRMASKHIPVATWRTLRDTIDNLKVKGLGEPPSSAPSVVRSTSLTRSSSAGSTGTGLASTGTSVEPTPPHSASKWRPCRQSEAVNERVVEMCKRLASSDWRERFQAVIAVTEWSENAPETVGHNVVKIFDHLIPRLTDSNSKVSLHALSCLLRVIPPLAPYLTGVVNNLVHTAAQTFASKQSDIAQAGHTVINTLVEHVDGTHLIQPFVQAVTTGNPRIKPDMITHLIPLVLKLGPRKPRLISLHILPELWRLLALLAPTSDTATTPTSTAAGPPHVIRPPTHNLVKHLHTLLGQDLLEAAKSNLTMTAAMLNLLQEMIKTVPPE